MTNSPLVTIVTPSLNQARFIEETLESVLTQDYTPLEYFVVDGGSNDGTSDILAASGPRVHWISEGDDGQADAINKGFRRANGAYLAWLNSDDVYLPGAIAAMAEYLDGHPDLDLVYGHVDNIDSSGRWLGPAKQVEKFDPSRLLNDVDFVAQPGTMFRRSAFERVGPLDTSLHWSFDYDLWLRFAAQGRLGLVDKVLAQNRIHPATKTMTGGLDRLLEIEKVSRTHGRLRIPNGFAARMAWARAGVAWDRVMAGDLSGALKHGGSSLQHLGAYASFRLTQLPHLGHFKSEPRRF
jgi:glycosyltransferase involved in cell wall biosynthesis